jgi:hypothetical protein
MAQSPSPSVAGVSPWRPGFALESLHVGSVVNKVALGQVSLWVFRFFPASVIPNWLFALIYQLGINNRPVWGRSSETHSHTIDINNSIRVRGTIVLGRCSCKLRTFCADVNTVYSRAKRTFILEYYFVTNPFVAVRESCQQCVSWQRSTDWDKNSPSGNKFRETKVSVKSAHRGKNLWNYGRTDFSHSIGCSKGIRLQEYSIAFGFVVLGMKVFICSSQCCVLNGRNCIKNLHAQVQRRKQ